MIRWGKLRLLGVTDCHGCACCIGPFPFLDPCYRGDGAMSDRLFAEACRWLLRALYVSITVTNIET